jgi:heme-degrading monooxygenase HmoA
MFARSTRVEVSPDKLDALVGLVRSAVEGLRQRDGYRSISVVANREEGYARIVSQWETREALQASEDMANEARARIETDVPGSRATDVERFEVAVLESAGPPQANTFVRATDARGAPEKIDELVAFVREKGIPLFKAQPGFRGAAVFANRDNGHVVGVTGWTSAAERDASEAAIAGLRGEAVQIGGAQSHVVERAEIIFVDSKVAAPA